MKIDPAATLHILNASAYEQPALLNRLLRMASTGDGLLLIENGVYGITCFELLHTANQHGITLYVLEADVHARGLQATEPFHVVDDAGFVGLCCQYRKTVSWFV